MKIRTFNDKWRTKLFESGQISFGMTDSTQNHISGNPSAFVLERIHLDKIFQETDRLGTRRSEFKQRAQLFVGRDTMIGEYCTIGCAQEQKIKSHNRNYSYLAERLDPVRISDNCLIGNHVTIYEGVKIGVDCVVDDYVRIGYDTEMGKDVRIMYGAYVCDRVTIGNNARIAGFICDGADIGDRSSVMGNLVHEYSKPHLDWWDVNEQAPMIENDVVVGYGANIIGGVRISSHSYVASGAIVTKDVPSQHIVVGINQIVPLDKWKGKRLENLIRHWNHERS